MLRIGSSPILRVLSALLFAALIAAVLVPSQWAIKNRPWYDYLYPAALWGAMLLFAISPGILRRPRSDQRFLAIILLLFLLTRLAWVLLVPTQPFSDFEEYNRWAAIFGQFQPIQGDMFRLSINLVMQPWLYPISLGILYDVFGRHLIIAELSNIVAGTITLLLVFLLARQLFDSKVARLSAILFLLWPTQLMYTSVLASEHLALVLALGAFVFLMPSLQEEKNNYRKEIIAGLLLGLSFATRYAAIIALASFILALVLTRRSFKWKTSHAGLLLGAFLITFGLYLGFVAVIWRQVPLPVGGLQLLQGTNLASGGTYTHADTNLYQAHATMSEANRFARAEAFRRIRSNPSGFISLMGNKTLAYWKDDFEGAYVSTERMNPGRANLFLTGNRSSLFAVSHFFHLSVLIIGCLACVFLVWRGGDARLVAILSYIAGGTLLHSIIIAHPRFHYAAEPLVIIVGAFGMTSLTSIALPRLAHIAAFSRKSLVPGLASFYARLKQPKSNSGSQSNTVAPWKTLLVLLAAGLILLIMTAPAFRYFFFDENFQTLGMYRVAGDNFWRAMWSPFAGFCFRPTAVAVNLPWHFVLPTDPWIYHLRNFAFSIINILLLHRVLLRLVASPWARALALFLFVVSKVHFTLIGYINLYDSLMMLMFLLLTILFFLRYLEQRRALDYGLALVFCFLSIFIKDYALVIVPVVVALVAFYGLTPREWRTQGGWWALRLSPLFLMVILYLALRFVLVGPLPKDNPGYSPQLSGRVVISNTLALTSAMGNLSLTGLSYTDAGATGGSGLGALIGRTFGGAGTAGLIDGATYILFMVLLLCTLALARRDRLKLLFPLVWIAAYFGPPLLIRNLQIYYFYEPLAGAAVLLGMSLDRSDPRFSRLLLKVWTVALLIVGVNGLISNYTSPYHWQSGADKVEKIKKPLLDAHRGEHVDEIIFVAAAKPFWRWAFQFHERAPMLAELMKAPGLKVSIYDYYEVPEAQVPPAGKTLFFEIDKGFNFRELRSLAELPRRTAAPSGADQTGLLRADPNPIRVCDGTGLGVTKISYTVAERKFIEIHVEAPDGPLLAKPTVSGTATTGKWVTDGMVFFMQDVSGGKSLTTENTIASVTVYSMSSGCQ